MNARKRVEGHATANVGTLGDSGNRRAYLGLTRRERSRAALLEFLSPSARKVAVDVQGLFNLTRAQSRPIKVVEDAFRHHSIVSATGVARLATLHQTRIQI